MTAPPNLDRESFQKLLADAFAVQQSGMDTEALSAIVQVQRSIATGEIDMDGTLRLIAERVRQVANAAGVAVGLLKGDQLVYRAGSGSAAGYEGQQVMATLCASTRSAATSEILRVENAKTDSRIEAAICRQFGAQSLLILPIYDDRAVAGVLEVLFNEAHVFQHREVCSYRLMALLIGEAMSYSAGPEQKEATAADLLTLQNIGQISPQMQKSLNDGGSAPEANRVGQSNWASPKYLSLYNGRWKTVTAVAAVLLIASWTANKDHHPAASLGSSPEQRANAKQQAPFVPLKTVMMNSFRPQTTPGLKEKARETARTIPLWVRVGDNELDYVAQDVTVRYFNSPPPSQPLPSRNNRVRYISEDVTVRYFEPVHTVEPPHPVGSAAHSVAR